MIGFWSIEEVLNLQGLNQRGYGQICFIWLRRLDCFLHNLGNEVA